MYKGVGHFWSPFPLWSTIGSLVVWSLCLCAFPPVQVVECTHMVDKSSTAPSGQFKGLSAGGRQIFHRGPRPIKGFPRAGDESSAANPANLNSMENEQAKGRPGGQARRAAIHSFSTNNYRDGSGRPKTLRILRIRIRNTVSMYR
jgi:hypothetical protein